MPEDLMEIEALRALAGPDVATPAATERAARDALAAAVADERGAVGRTPRVRIRRMAGGRRRLAVLVAAGTLVVAGGAAAYVELTPSKVSAGILCAADVAREPSGTAIANDGRPLSEQCAELWRRGEVGASAEEPAQLSACESGHGATYVYAAGAEVCGRLGLRPAPDAPSAEDRRYVAFREAIAQRLTGCVGLDHAAELVRRELDAHGLGDWTVQADAQPSAARRCASLDADSGARVVTVVPIDRP